jgi:hypothetical protein
MRDGCKVGDVVGWQAVNGPVMGTVERVDDEGLLVRLRDGRQMILSTTLSLEAARQKRRTTDIYSNP